MSFSDTLNDWLQTSPVYEHAEQSTLASKNTSKNMKETITKQHAAAVKGSAVVTSWIEQHLTEVVFILLGIALVVGGIFVFKNSMRPIIVQIAK